RQALHKIGASATACLGRRARQLEGVNLDTRVGEQDGEAAHPLAVSYVDGALIEVERPHVALPAHLSGCRRYWFGLLRWSCRGPLRLDITERESHLFGALDDPFHPEL